MARDITKVIDQLKQRWITVYGDHIGTEEIRRTMSSMLYDLQMAELVGVFSGWSAEDLSLAIRETADERPVVTLADDDTMADDLTTLESVEVETVAETQPKARRNRRTHAELAAAGHPKYAGK
jgi:hypothetical protein